MTDKPDLDFGPGRPLVSDRAVAMLVRLAYAVLATGLFIFATLTHPEWVQGLVGLVVFLVFLLVVTATAP